MRLIAFIPLLFIFVGILLSVARVRPAMVAWGLCALGVLIGLGIAIAIVVTGQSNLWGYALVAALPFIVAVPMVIKDLGYPRINDVTTAPENPPAFRAALKASQNLNRDMEFPEQNGPIVREGYPNLRSLILNEAPKSAFQRIAKLAKAQPGWVVTRHDSENLTIEGEATTSVLRFVDDFVIRVTNSGGDARIDMRSKSREGLVDAGKNAKRIQAFFKRLKTE